jgi:ferric-dicitrate binding protein FerR (iron transport regulator)
VNLQQAQLLAKRVLAGEANTEDKAALQQYITDHAQQPELEELLFPIAELTTMPEQALPAGMEERILHRVTDTPTRKGSVRRILHRITGTNTRTGSVRRILHRITGSLTRTASMHRITGHPTRTATVRRLLPFAAAAVVLIAICTSAYWLFTATPAPPPLLSLHTEAGSSKEISLTDGTHIRLNGGTTLRYPTHFSGKSREVYLDGEAFFEVSKDSSHPFIIHSPALTTTVLGTSFNVKTSANEAMSEVAVATGKVRVAVTGQEVLLTPGEKVHYVTGDPAGMHKDSIAITTIGAWKDRRFYYDRSPLSGILLDLERAYGLHFRVKNPALAACTYSATFKLMSPEEILQTLTLMSQVKFSHKDSLIEVSGPSCN